MIDTWGGKSKFEYQGGVRQGTKIIYGKNNRITVTAVQYQRLIDNFAGKNVSVSSGRTNPVVGSLGDWLRQNVTKTAIAVYVAPILIQEGFAVRTSETTLMFYEIDG